MYPRSLTPPLVAMLGLSMLGLILATPQSVQGQENAVTQLDPKLASLIDSSAKVKKVASGFGFIEGPVWVPDPAGSYLLFSDIPGNKVFRLDKGGKVSVEIDPVMESDSPAGGTGGSNGLNLDLEGRVVLCEHGNRRVARLEKDGTRTTLADRYDGKRLNSPNDIIFHSSGSAYFTDPSYGLPQGKGKELDWHGIYRLGTEDAKGVRSVELLEKGMENPNGIGLSPDEKTLYVANSNLVKRLWMAYPVKADGSLGVGKVHFDGSDLKAPGVPDGFGMDELGNIWASGPGGIVVIAPDGKHLGTIAVPEQPANAAFGGDDGKTLFMTARTGLYSLRVKVKGLARSR